MAEKINLEEHLAKGVEKIVSDSLKATMKDPRESAFMVKFAAASRKATGTSSMTTTSAAACCLKSASRSRRCSRQAA